MVFLILEKNKMKIKHLLENNSQKGAPFNLRPAPTPENAEKIRGIKTLLTFVQYIFGHSERNYRYLDFLEEANVKAFDLGNGILELEINFGADARYGFGVQGGKPFDDLNGAIKTLGFDDYRVKFNTENLGGGKGRCVVNVYEEDQSIIEEIQKKFYCVGGGQVLMDFATFGQGDNVIDGRFEMFKTGCTVSVSLPDRAYYGCIFDFSYFKNLDRLFLKTFFSTDLDYDLAIRGVFNFVTLQVLANAGKIQNLKGDIRAKHTCTFPFLISDLATWDENEVDEKLKAVFQVVSAHNLDFQISIDTSHLGYEQAFFKQTIPSIAYACKESTVFKIATTGPKGVAFGEKINEIMHDLVDEGQTVEDITDIFAQLAEEGGI